METISANITGAVEIVPTRILVIDDEQGMRDLLTRELASLGYYTESAADGVEALERVENQPFHIVLCDMSMPKLSGLEVLEQLKKKHPDVDVVMMTGYATISTAIDAMKKGAYDFIEKPFQLERIFGVIQNIQEKQKMKSVIQELREAKKKIEEMQGELIQSEKLAGIGQLAAGVAHELNNPLSGVLGFTQLLLADKTLTPPQREDMETIHAQAQRCRVIIQNLLQFSRRQEPKKERVDMAAIVRSVIQLVKYEFSTAGIDIVEKMPPALPLIFGDAHQLQQVLLNLLTNARQALEGVPEARLIIEAEQNNERVILRVMDNGCGIPLENLNKIFDPFFTTKPVGKGTGLGLSICYGIVQQHEGTLRAESIGLQQGATLILELPIQEHKNIKTPALLKAA